MKRIKELPSFVATVLASTGYQIGAGLSEVVHTAAYALRMGLIIVPAQTSNGTTIPFAVRFTRLVSTNDEDTTMELQVHSVTGRKHDFSIKTGCKIYIFTCSGLFTATATRDVAIKQLGPTSLRDDRLFLSERDSAYQAPAAAAQTHAFVLGQAPFDSAASKVTSKEEVETETYELTEHSAHVKQGTSSSPVSAKMGSTIALGGVAGSAMGKTYVQFLKPGVMPHMTLASNRPWKLLDSALTSLLNFAKCSILNGEGGCTPGVWGRGVAGPLSGTDHLTYLGVPLCYHSSTLRQLGVSLAKTSSACFALDTPVKEKLALFQSYVASKWAWCSPVVYPSARALKSLEAFKHTFLLSLLTPSALPDECDCEETSH